MEGTSVQRTENRPDGRFRLSGPFRKWSAFLLSMALVWLFILVIAPWVQKSPSIQPLAQFIEESGIDASALYYTEVEEASIAELNMRSTMEYRPNNSPGQ